MGQRGQLVHIQTPPSPPLSSSPPKFSNPSFSNLGFPGKRLAPKAAFLGKGFEEDLDDPYYNDSDDEDAVEQEWVRRGLGTVGKVPMAQSL